MYRARSPQLLGYLQRFSLEIGPPTSLVAVPMEIVVVGTAERNGKLVAYFAAQGPWLSILHMMCITGRPFANYAGLRSYE